MGRGATTRARRGRRVASAAHALLLLGPVALTGGCDQGGGFVRGERLELSSCSRLDEPEVFEPFERELDFMGVVRERSRAWVRASPEAGTASVHDQLVLSIPRADRLEEAVAEAEAQGELPLERPLGPEGRRVGLTLLGTCSESVDPLVTDEGVLRVEAFGTGKGDRVALEMAFTLMNQRTGERVGHGFEAEVDFDVRLGAPYQPFNDPARVD